MIFGKTNEYKEAFEQRWLEYLVHNRIKQFVIFPTKLANGTYACMRFVYKEYPVSDYGPKYNIGSRAVDKRYFMRQSKYRKFHSTLKD